MDAWIECKGNGLRKKSPQSGRFQGFGGEGHHQQLVASRNARVGSAEKDRTDHAGACKRHGICPPPQRIRSHHDLQPVMSAPQCRKPSLNARTHQGHSASASPSPTPPSIPLSIDSKKKLFRRACVWKPCVSLCAFDANTCMDLGTATWFSLRSPLQWRFAPRLEEAPPAECLARRARFE